MFLALNLLEVVVITIITIMTTITQRSQVLLDGFICLEKERPKSQTHELSQHRQVSLST